MPRPNKQAERKLQILTAMGDCVARYGLYGATLEKIAEQAGLARALVRHNVGNRDILVVEFIDNFLDKSYAASKVLFASLPDNEKATALIEVLFDPAFSDPKSLLIAEALIAAGHDDSALAERMRKWVRDFNAEVEAVIKEDYPKAEPETTAGVAAGLVGIYFNVESMTPLGDMPDLRSASKRAALALITTLES